MHIRNELPLALFMALRTSIPIATTHSATREGQKDTFSQGAWGMSTGVCVRPERLASVSPASQPQCLPWVVASCRCGESFFLTADYGTRRCEPMSYEDPTWDRY